MKKITTNAESVRVVGNLIPDFDEVTSANYFIYRNVTHTQNGTVRHLGDDRLVRKVVASKVNTTLYMEATVGTNKEVSFYVKLTADGSYPPENLVARLSYSDSTNIGLVTLEPTGGEGNWYSEGTETFTLQGSGIVTINAEFEGYQRFHSSSTSININLTSEAVLEIPTTNIYRVIGYTDNRSNVNIPTLNSNGYITNPNGDYFVCSPVPLTFDSKVELKFRTNSVSIFQVGLQAMMNTNQVKYAVFSGGSTATLEEQHYGENQTTKSVNTYATDTTVTVVFEVDEEGYITYRCSNTDTKTSTNPFTRSELGTMLLTIRKWSNANAIQLEELTYYYKNKTVYHMLGNDVGEVATTGGSGTPTVEVVNNRTAIKAVSDNLNATYFGVDIDLRKITTISFDYYVSDNTNSSRVGIITTHAVGTGGLNFKQLCTLKNNTDGTVIENFTSEESGTRYMSGRWENIRIIIKQRSATIIYNSTYGLVYKTVSIPTIHSDTTFNNLVKLGLQSVGSSNPTTAIRNIYIIEE